MQAAPRKLSALAQKLASARRSSPRIAGVSKHSATSAQARRSTSHHSAAAAAPDQDAAEANAATSGGNGSEAQDVAAAAKRSTGHSGRAKTARAQTPKRKAAARDAARTDSPAVVTSVVEVRAGTAQQPPSAKKVKRARIVEARPMTEELHEKSTRIQAVLQDLYPDMPCPLDSSSNFQLLIAVILSSQTTDKKVNQVTPALFEIAPDAAALAAADVGVIQSIIREVGLAPTKSKNIVKCAQQLMERHHGQVPATFPELEALAGVGHKTASVVMATCFGCASAIAGMFSKTGNLCASPIRTATVTTAQ